jgi:protein TonB
MLPPPEDPEEPETNDNPKTGAGGGTPDAVAPPSLIDTPSVIVDPTAFIQNIQPPPPPGPSVPPGLIAVPAGRPGSGTLFDFGTLDQKPEPIMQIRPEYPYQLRREGITGTVHVIFVVDTHGEVRAPRIHRSSHPGFEQPVLQAIRRWKFKPGRKGGAAVTTTNVQITLTFNLGDAP